MAYKDAGLASGYILRLTVNVASQNIALNTTTYSFSLVIHKGSGSGKWMSGTSYWSVRTPFGNVISSGSIGSYDFRNYSALTLVSSSITIAGSAGREWGGVFDDNDSWGELGDGTISGLIVTPPSIPLTPSALTVTRVSDAQQTLAWTNGSTYSSVVIQRSTDDGAFVEINRPAGSPTTFADTTTQANRKYVYRVAGIGGAGQSGWSNTATIYTSPAAPASATAERITQTLIRVNATGLPPYATLYDIMDGSTVVATGVSLPWDHVNPNPATPHAYRVRGTIGAIQGAWSAPSNTVQLQAPPNAPTSLSPNGTTANVASNTSLRWLHNSVDASVQTQYQIRRRAQGSATWIDGAITTSANSEYSAAPSFFGGVGNYEWQVRTRGADPNFSPWSATATITLINAPTAAINSPGPLHAASRVTVAWAYAQLQGRPQSAWELQLFREGQVVEDRSGTGATAELLLNTRLEDQAVYTVRVRVAAGDVWSPLAEQEFAVRFLRPAPPTLEGEWNEQSGSVSLTVQDSRDPDAPTFINLFTNPKFLTTSTPVEIWRNRCKVPIPSSDWSASFGNGSGTVGFESINGANFLRATWTTATTAGNPIIDFGQADTSLYTEVGEGDEVVVSLDAATTIANGKVFFAAYWLDENFLFRGAVASATMNVSADVANPQRLTWTTPPAPESVSYMVLMVQINTAPPIPAGSRFYLGNVLMQMVYDLQSPYFDGNAVPSHLAQPEDFTATWAGPPNKSVSSINGRRVTGLTAYRGPVIASTRNGKPAVRMIGGALEGANYMYSFLPSGSIRNGGTVLGVCESDALIPAGTDPFKGGISSFSPAAGTPGDLSPAPTAIRHSFGALSSVYRIMWHGPEKGDPDMWWTDLGIFEGNYSGPYFDGSMGQIVIDGYPLNTSWAGAVSASPSFASPPEEALRIELERSVDGGLTWEYIATLPPTITNLSDFESLSCGLTKYRAVSVSAEGATDETITDVLSNSLAIYIGGGAGFSHVARLPYDPSVKIGSAGRRRAVEEYEGRERPVAYASRRKVLSLSASGTIFDDDIDAAIRDRLEDVIEDPSPVHCFRDFYGNRYYGAVSPVSFDGLGRRPSCAPSCASGYWRYGFSMEGTERV